MKGKESAKNARPVFSGDNDVSSLFQAASRRGSWKIIGLALLGWCVIVAGIFGYERAVLWATRNDAGFGERVATEGGAIDSLFKFKMPGIVRPATVQAEASTIRPDEEVIGFLVGGRARAYRLNAFRDRSKHVVNDLVAGVPVTVAYCDISDCVSAYQGHEGSAPLDVSVGGLSHGGEMVLEVGGLLYYQKSGTRLVPGSGPSMIPLEQLSPARTTWGEWKRQHPSTDVYEGLR
jgi:hypothetical protein